MTPAGASEAARFVAGLSGGVHGAPATLSAATLHPALEASGRAAFSIDLESVSFASEPLYKEDLDRLVMVVPLEGGYTNLRKFLQAVEESDKFLLVERVALAEGREGGVMLQLNITLATYFDLPEELRQRRGAGGRA